MRCELIGGPADGQICDLEAGTTELRIPIREPAVHFVEEEEPTPTKVRGAIYRLKADGKLFFEGYSRQ